VADLFTQPAGRPKEVKRAEWILWAWTTWICVYGIYQTVAGTSGADAMLGEQLQAVAPEITSGMMKPIILGAYVLVALTMAGVVAQLGKGRRWARFSLVLSFVAEILFFTGGTASDYINYAVDLGLQAAALYLLYTGPGREWFVRRPKAASG
jgi:glycerol uptake facilitator-like aquaporin